MDTKVITEEEKLILFHPLRITRSIIMHPNEQLIEKFYSSFKVLDAAGMTSCYHPEIVFSDPVFGSLSGADASTMWKMLCSRATDLKISFTDVRADNATGTAH